MRPMLNASFEQLGYYTEIDEDEFAYQVDGLGYLIDERIALYLFKAGTPIGFLLCIPDISAFVRKVNGDLGLLNQLRLFLTRSATATRRSASSRASSRTSKGMATWALWGELLRNLRAAGYHTLRGTFVEHANVASSSYADRLGRPAHGIAFYARDVA